MTALCPAPGKLQTGIDSYTMGTIDYYKIVQSIDCIDYYGL